MNYISTLLGIMQDWDWDNESEMRYSENYSIELYTTRTKSRLRIKKHKGSSSEIFDMFVGPGVSAATDSQQYGLQHHLCQRRPNDNSRDQWYQLFLPCQEIKTVQYKKLNGFELSEICTVNIHDEADIFQKSTIADIDIKEVNSLIIESTQCSPYMTSTDKMLLLISGYERFDFNEIFEALK